jgi:hypothetical protein
MDELRSYKALMKGPGVCVGGRDNKQQKLWSFKVHMKVHIQTPRPHVALHVCMWEGRGGGEQCVMT